MSDLNQFEQITEITFDHNGAHLALTHKAQGYSANKKPQPLLVKSEDIVVPDEAIEIVKAIDKGQDVQITVSMKEFLERFFGVWGSDAVVLATILGYKPEDTPSETYEDWIQSRVDSVEILRSAKESGKVSLSGYDMIQKSMERESKLQKESHAKGADVEKSTASPSVEHKTPAKENTPLEKEKQTMTDVVTTEELTKAQDLIKAQAEALEKATARVAALEKAEKERIEKAYVEMTKSFSFVKDEDKVSLAKAILATEEVARATIVEALEKAQEVIKQYVTKEDGYETGDEPKGKLEKTRSAINERIAQKYKTKE